MTVFFIADSDWTQLNLERTCRLALWNSMPVLVGASVGTSCLQLHARDVRYEPSLYPPGEMSKT